LERGRVSIQSQATLTLGLLRSREGGQRPCSSLPAPGRDRLSERSGRLAATTVLEAGNVFLLDQVFQSCVLGLAVLGLRRSLASPFPLTDRGGSDSDLSDPGQAAHWHGQRQPPEHPILNPRSPLPAPRSPLSALRSPISNPLAADAGLFVDAVGKIRPHGGNPTDGVKRDLIFYPTLSMTLYQPLNAAQNSNSMSI
jgi:hypothetical protein